MRNHRKTGSFASGGWAFRPPRNVLYFAIKGLEVSCEVRRYDLSPGDSPRGLARRRRLAKKRSCHSRNSTRGCFTVARGGGRGGGGQRTFPRKRNDEVGRFGWIVGGPGHSERV